MNPIWISSKAFAVMKFLEDAKLAQLTADLTDAPLVGCHGGGSHHGGHHHEGGGVPRAGTGSQQPRRPASSTAGSRPTPPSG